MPTLPAEDLRSNLATWGVPSGLLPAAARVLIETLPTEPYDPDFLGQELTTTYLDTPQQTLRRHRRKGQRYITVRVRRYDSRLGVAFALSVKTEDEKFRVEIDADDSRLLTAPIGDRGPTLERLLPGHLLARLRELAHAEALIPAAVVTCRRYAVEDDVDRLTLDVNVACDLGKRLPCAVLEFKSRQDDAPVPQVLRMLGLRPTKLSKFLWATEMGGAK